jgi:hypothetical protein
MTVVIYWNGSVLHVGVQNKHGEIRGIDMFGATSYMQAAEVAYDWGKFYGCDVIFITAPEKRNPEKDKDVHNGEIVKPNVG